VEKVAQEFAPLLKFSINRPKKTIAYFSLTHLVTLHIRSQNSSQPAVQCKKSPKVGEPLLPSDEKLENKQSQKIPGLLPSCATCV
jgi:hypothetical protein